MRPAVRMLYASQAIQRYSPEVLRRKVFRPPPGLPAPPPSVIEKGWLKYWDSLQPIRPPPPQVPPKAPFRMIMPPPNVTGVLHIGHATMLTVQDVLARYYRMHGHEVSWLPGTDHAGIATQTVVERNLMDQGVHEAQLNNRDVLVKEIWKWTDEHGGKIKEQIERMGVLTDKDKEYFTLEEGLSTAVRRAFVKLHEQGLIYRDTRMVNWCTSLQTALSDIEVEYVEVDRPTFIDATHFGLMWEVAYKVVDPSYPDEEVVVATTRPETLFGDRAVAVHPDDERYKHLHYKFLQHPLIPHLEIPVIPDADLVDPTLGTGAVKITPAHDPDDYEFWRRHSTFSPTFVPGQSARMPIPLVEVFDRKGRMLPSCEVEGFVGHDRLWVRKKLALLLKDLGALRGSYNHKMRVAKCSRTQSVIEPMLAPQWYMKMKPLAELVQQTMKEQGLKIRPERFEVEWNKWLDNIQDWCLSRQIAWGHRIPAWAVVDRDGTELRWIIADTEEEARKQMTRAESFCTLKQDDDVLDTWFSSGLLPLSTAGWRGDEQIAWKKMYPLSLMESGADILFFWLARMAMLCTWFSKTLPFKEILLHPLICDANGRKMSKSEGNVLDPQMFINGITLQGLLEPLALQKEKAQEKPEAARVRILKTIEKKERELKTNFPRGIPGEGTDSLRMALAKYSSSKRDSVALDPKNVNMYRRFIVKLENAFKLIQQKIPHGRPVTLFLNTKTLASLQPHEVYVLHHLRDTVARVNTAIEQRDLGEAVTAINDYVYDHFCDIYLEFAKVDFTVAERQQTAFDVSTFSLDIIFRLLHPFSPFITEDLWQQLDDRRMEDMKSSIIYSPFPLPSTIPKMDDEEKKTSGIETIAQIVRGARKFGASPKLKQKSKFSKYVLGVPPQIHDLAEMYVHTLRKLVFAGELRILKTEEPELKDLLRSHPHEWFERDFVVLSEGTVQDVK